MDWNYKTIARSINFEIDKVQGDDLNKFPIERARVRLSEAIILLRAASVIGYGWTLQRKVVGVTDAILGSEAQLRLTKVASRSSVDVSISYRLPRYQPGIYYSMTSIAYINILNRHSIHYL
jgi:hypothetical protein